LQKIFGIISSNRVIKRTPGPKSLNLINRKKENKRINYENKQLLNNLVKVEPTYKFDDLKRHEVD